MIILFFILSIFTPHALQAQEQRLPEEHVATITRIVRHVTSSITAPDQDMLTPEQEKLITQISQQLIQDAALYQAEQIQTENNRQERKDLLKTIVLNVSKGIAIIIALLVLRQIIKSIGRGTATESPDTPLSVIITTRTPDQAIALGKNILDQNLATGGAMTPTIQSFYRQDNKAYITQEAMLILKTTNENLQEIIVQTENDSTGAPEIIAIPRSIISS